MNMRSPIFVLAAALGLHAADCAGLAKLELPSTEIALAEQVTAGSFKPPVGGALSKLPPFCRVAGSIKPTADSDIRFEVWLPVSGWNGKFQGIGNGGFAGTINFGGLADAVRNGYAAASTDTGHQSTLATDASWALGRPEKVTDFGHRAIHEMTVKGKALAESYYGSKPKRSYFNSCSNGGRQALMEAQRYPEDYDGIIAGAPANYWTKLLSLAASAMKATAGNPAAYIGPSKLPAIQVAALSACDAADGVSDGVVENPGACRFDPGVLLCRGAENDQCLTAPQLAALRKLYGGLRDMRGRPVYPGYAMSGEAEQGGWGPWITGPGPEKSMLFAFGTNFFKFIVYGDAGWDYKTFSMERDYKDAVKKVAAVLDSADPDLRRFKARGGKLILYHGWCDAAIPAQGAIDYYESVVKKMGAKSAGEFVRLLMVPGMQHCMGGAGPSQFGQGGVAQGDPRSNLAAALERWVEQGAAPEEVIATKYRKGMDPASGVERTRPLCAYPKTARYKGAGSTDDAANFECVAPAKAR
jgi:feruloyl esterase